MNAKIVPRFHILHSMHYNSTLHFEPTNAHNFIKVLILQHTTSNFFRASLAHQ